MKHTVRPLPKLALLALAFASLQCGKDGITLPSEGEPAAIEIVQGDPQTGEVGTPLPDSLIVRITDSRDRPVSGQPIVFKLVLGGLGADLIPDTVLTDTDGRARTRWVLGQVAGSQTVEAHVIATGSAGSLQATFHATAVAGAAATIALVAGDQQTGQVGTALSDLLVVRVTDQFANPVEGVTVDWTAGGGGTISASSVVTGTDGNAAVQRVLGTTAGGQTAEASVLGLAGSPVVFTHTATAGTAVALVKDPVTDGQFGLVGFALTDSIVVIVKDASGNGVPGRDVLWTLGLGGGTVAPTTSVTDADGKAFTRWTLGPTAGNNTVNAASAGLAPVTFTATATAAQPSRIVAASPTTLNGTAGSPVTTPPSVKVTDANNNPVRGETVTFTITAGGGTLSDGTTTGTTTTIATNSSGVAALSAWTLGATAGSNSLSVSATDQGGAPLQGSPVFFNGTGQAGAAAQLVVSTQPSATGQSGVTLAVQPVVQLQDALGNPVAQSGKQVTVSVTGGGATLAGNLTVATNASGAASFSGLSLTGPVGSYTLSFSASGLIPATSGSIDLSAGAVAKLVVATQPSSVAQSGVAFAQQPTVQVADAAGNPVGSVGVTVTAALASGGGTLGGTLSRTTNALGLASFTDLAITGAPGARTLTFSAGGLGNATSQQINLSAGGATQLAMATQPSATAQSGVVLARQPEVQLQDAGGNDVAQAGVTVHVTVSTGGTLVGTNDVATDAAGLASFSGFSISGLVGNYTLTFDAPGFTSVTSTAIALSAGSAAAIARGAGDGQSAAAGSAVPVDPSVLVTDASGNPVAGVSVTFAAATGGGTVVPTAPVTSNSLGLATVTSWTLGAAVGTNTLTATAGGLTGSPLTFTATGVAGSASRLALATQPASTAQSGVAFAQQPVIQLQDNLGNPVNQAGVSVSASIASGGGSLGGLASATTNGSGVATFTNLQISGTIGTRTLLFAANGFISVASNNIVLSAGNAATLAKNAGDAQSATVGTAVAIDPSVLVTDASGNPVGNVSVTFAIGTGSGSLTGGAATTNGSGIATVGSWTLGITAGTKTLTATSSGLSGSPATFTATGTADAADHLTLTTQPSTTAQSGVAFGQQPVVQLRDQFGNSVSQASTGITVIIASGGGALGGTATVQTNAGGAAAFAGLLINGLVGGRTLSFSATSLTGITSGTINLIAGPASAISKSAGDAQSAPGGSAVPIDPAVLVTDAAGNPVSGTGVTFAVATGGGTVVPTTPVTSNASGIATATSWTLGSVAGTNTLTATSGSLTGSPLTFTATGTTGSATKLVLTTQPSATAQSGVALASQPVVQLKDGPGNNVAQANVNVTAAVSVGGSLVGTATVPTNGSGAAVFTGLGISGLVGNYTLSFSAASLTGATSNAIALSAGTAAKLGVNRQPSAAAQSGVAIPVQPRIQIQDAAGNSVNQGGTTITASFASGTGTLGNATAVTSAAGLATFAGLNISGVVGSYTLQFDAPSVTGITANAITLNAGPANHVTITVQPPPTASSGVALSPPPVVQLRDGAGNPVSQGGRSINASIASGSGGTLTNTVATTDVTGQATFTGLTLSGPSGNFTLAFGGAGLTSAASNQVALGAGSGSLLSITTQPSASAQNGVAFAQQPAIQLRDGSNNPVNTPNVVVSVAIVSGGGTLNGTSTALTNGSGLATFTGLSITGTIGNRTLIFSAGGFVSATSNVISITAGSATQLTLTTAPSAGVQSGIDFPTQPVVQLRDQSGNTVNQSNVPINAVIATGGGTLGGTLPVNTNGSGQAVFTDLAISGLIGARTLTFSSSGLSSVTSGAISVTAGSADHLTITTQPSASAGSGVEFPQQPVIQLRDGAGNAVAQASVDIDVAVATGTATLSGTTTVSTNGSGTANFTDLALSGTAGSNTLLFSSSGLTGVTSGTVTLGAGSANKLFIATQPSSSAQNATGFGQQPAIQLRDAANNPVSQANVPITAAIALGGGSLGITTTVNTNAGGLATFTNLQITGLIGVRTLTFTSGSLAPATSNNVTITAGSPDAIELSDGDGQTADAGTAVAVDPEVLVTDVSGNVVSGASVTFAVATGGGVVVPISAVLTDGTGHAAATSWTLGNTPGSNTLTATSGTLNGSPVTFTATGVVGPPDRLTITTQPSSTAQNTVAFPQQPAIQIRDAAGNPVLQNNVQVTVAIASGGGVLGGSTVTVNTDPNGLASFPDLEITGLVGNRTLTFTSSGLNPVTSNPIDLIAGPPRTIVEQGGDGQSAAAGTAVAVDPRVLIRDESGNPVQGAAVTFAVASGGGIATGLNPTTDVNGLASVGSWTLGTTVGSNTLTASSGSLTGSPVTFTATGDPGPADASQSSATVPDGTILLETVMTVQARDQFGNALTSGGSTVVVTVTGVNNTSAAVTDNGDGTYTARYTCGVLPGADTITITLDGTEINGSPYTSNVVP